MESFLQNQRDASTGTEAKPDEIDSKYSLVAPGVARIKASSTMVAIAMASKIQQEMQAHHLEHGESMNAVYRMGWKVYLNPAEVDELPHPIYLHVIGQSFF